MERESRPGVEELIVLEWLNANGWGLWFIAAGLLAVAEMLTLDLTLLMLASGALAAGVTALLLPGLIWAHVLVGVVVAVTTLFVVRPLLLKRYRNAPGYRSSMEKMVGNSGRVVRAVTAAGGEVKVDGEIWTARSYDGATIEEGVEVEVFEVDGATAVVYPKHKALG